MIYAKDYLKYDGLAALSNYNFASIRAKLEAYPSNPPQEDDPTYIHWEPIIKNYNEATDSIAHFICDFVESIPMVNYTPNATGVSLALAAVRVQSLGYKLNVTGINTEPYNAEDMMDYLRFKKAILIMGGSGHCWTVEGGVYCLWPTPNQINLNILALYFIAIGDGVELIMDIMKAKYLTQNSALMKI